MPMTMREAQSVKRWKCENCGKRFKYPHIKPVYNDALLWETPDAVWVHCPNCRWLATPVKAWKPRPRRVDSPIRGGW